MLKKLLSHPLTYGLSVDDSKTTLLRKQIIQEKKFLRKIYTEWYQNIFTRLDDSQTVLEIGSGAGFLNEILPNAITSEVFPTPQIKLVTNACTLPFDDNTLDAIVMTDVFHHIPDVATFLTEATRCVRSLGKIIMIEPWRTTWSEWIYKNLHSEPFDIDASWKLPKSGPLSGANGALPWIVFERDIAIFAELHPEWEIIDIKKLMPLAYILSGGVSMRNFAPGWMYNPIRKIERLIEHKTSAMFAIIELKRV